LCEQGGSLDEAYQVIKRSLLLKTTAQNQFTLAEILRAQGKIRASLEAYELGYKLHEAGPQRWEWSPEVGQWLKEARRLAEPDDRLPALLQGIAQPASPVEALEFGRLCLYKSLFAAAARFYKDAFTLDPTLAAQVLEGHRYLAACAAAQCGCGRG